MTIQINLYDHSGHYLADTFEHTYSNVVSIGDFITRAHPGFNNEVRSWKVVGIDHNHGVSPPTQMVIAWEISELDYNNIMVERAQKA